MKTTKKISFAAMLSALSVVIVWLGTIIEVTDLSAVAIASFVIAFAHIELKGYYPYLIYAATSVLLLLLIPMKVGTFMYILFGGIYPTIKLFAERLARPLSLLCKSVSFVVFLALGALGMYIIGDPFLERGKWLLVGFAVFAFLVLVVYDYALTVVISFYTFRLRPKIQKYFR